MQALLTRNQSEVQAGVKAQADRVIMGNPYVYVNDTGADQQQWQYKAQKHTPMRRAVRCVSVNLFDEQL